LEKVFKIRVHSDSLELVKNTVRDENLDVGCTGGIISKDNEFSIDAYASEQKVSELRKKVFEKEISTKISLDISDITEQVSDRLKEVGKGDRFEQSKAVPHGLGKMVKE
jgi:hypothetical protein